MTIEPSEAPVKLTEDQLSKLNQASELMGLVRAQLVRLCEAMPDDDPDKTGWTPLFQIECKLNVLLFQMKHN